MAPPLAGKPPFATDEPDSFYDSSSQTTKPLRIRQQKPEDPNKRSSAYDMYENYLKDAQPMSTNNSKLAPSISPPSANRNSGIGNLLLSMDDSDSEDEDDSPPPVRRAAPPPPQQQQQPPTKSPSPKPIAAPRPGYAAPLAALNLAGATSPSPTNSSGPPDPQGHGQGPNGMRMPMPPPQAAQMGGPGGGRPSFGQNPFEPGSPHPHPHPQSQNPFEPPLAQQFRGPPSPGGPNGPGAGVGAGPPRLLGPMAPGSPAPSMRSMSSTPHPLLPPMTPIRPVFIQPSKSPSPDDSSNEKMSEKPKEETNGSTISVKFNTPAAPLPPARRIMRGNTEETLLPSRGQKGDDFWRRFSIVAKDPSSTSLRGESSWLKKTRSGSSQLSRWVWIIGILLILCILGGVGLGIYVTRNSPNHQQPKAIGGGAGNANNATVADANVPGGGAGAAGGAAPAAAPGFAPGQRPSAGTTIKHVSPTNTVARRELEWALPTPAIEEAVKRHLESKKRRLEGGVW